MNWACQIPPVIVQLMQTPAVEYMPTVQHPWIALWQLAQANGTNLITAWTVFRHWHSFDFNRLRFRWAFLKVLQNVCSCRQREAICVRADMGWEKELQGTLCKCYHPIVLLDRGPTSLRSDWLTVLTRLSLIDPYPIAWAQKLQVRTRMILQSVQRLLTNITAFRLSPSRKTPESAIRWPSYKNCLRGHNTWTNGQRLANWQVDAGGHWYLPFWINKLCPQPWLQSARQVSYMFEYFQVEKWLFFS